MDRDVYKAASEGNINVLRGKKDHLHQLLTPTKHTVLHIYIESAASTNQEESQQEVENVEKILELCPPLLFQPNASGDTALHVAARHGKAHIVEILLRHAAKSHPYLPHHRDDNLEKGMSSSEDPANMLQMLIETTNNERDTALHEAVRFNHVPVASLLTEKYPEFSYSPNADGDTPLYLAAERGYRHLVSLILETKCKYPSNYRGRNGRTALHAAVICKDEEMTRQLLMCFKDSGMAQLTKVVDERGWTPLHFAAFFDYSTIAKVLLESDESAAYVGDKEHNRTPLHIAALEGNLDLTKDLISYSPACCELVDHKGRNLLHYATKWGRSEIVDLVLDHTRLSNILSNRKDTDGNTPLHILTVSSEILRTDTTKRFIGDARVDKMAFNKKNLNALDIILADATHSPQLKSYIQDILKEKGAKPGHHRDEGKIRNLDRREIVTDQKREIEENKVGKGYNEILKEIKDAHLVVATLIATVTFTAGFTMPGGYQNEKGSGEGFAVLTRNAAFKAFVITDTLAMALSTCSVLMHFYVASAKQKEIPEILPLALSFTMYAFIAMLIAFITGVYAALGDCIWLGVAACVLTCTIIGAAFFFLAPASKGVRTALLKLAQRQRSSAN